MRFYDVLKERLPEEKVSHLPKGFEVIGDIAIINIPSSLENEKYLIARALVSHRKDIRTVLRKTGKLDGATRVGRFELLTGNSTTTFHRENGCIFQLDVRETYFSGKLGYERARIVQSVHDGEDVLVLFCGVGPFLIPIKKKRDVSMTGLDINPAACRYLLKNAALNHIETDIIIGDANSMGVLFKKRFDRIVMPTPYGQDYFLNLTVPILRPGGMVHFYTFKKDFEIAHFKKVLEKRGWYIHSCRNTGGVAPRVNRYVFDLERAHSL